VFGEACSLLARYAQHRAAASSVELRGVVYSFEGDTLLLERPILLDGENIGTIVLRCSLHDAYAHMQRT